MASQIGRSNYMEYCGMPQWPHTNSKESSPWLLSEKPGPVAAAAAAAMVKAAAKAAAAAQMAILAAAGAATMAVAEAVATKRPRGFQIQPGICSQRAKGASRSDGACPFIPT